MKKIKLFTSIHKATKRNYLKRMNDNKPYYMSLAKKYSKDYWDGKRKSGYGGYKYIDGYWKPAAKKLIKEYNLKNSSSILDVGCGKGFLLFEIKKLLKNIKILGLDKSKYAIRNSPKSIKKFLKIGDAGKKMNFLNKKFDLAISLGCIHNLEINQIKTFLGEITRVSKKQYIMTESYRNDKELFNLQCWALTCESFFSPREWLWIFKEFNYSGDYELIFFE